MSDVVVVSCRFMLIYVILKYIMLERGIEVMNTRTLDIFIIEDDVAACRKLRQYIEKIDR